MPALQSRVRLTSANSISLGRLLPQMFYYAYAALQCRGATPLVVSVPSGNFGNLVGRRDGVEDRRADRRASPRRRRSTTRCRATSRPDASSRGRRCRRSPTRWMSATRATSSVCNGCSAATSTAMRTLISSTRAHRRRGARRDRRAAIENYGYVADPHTAIAYLGTQAAARQAARHLQHCFLSHRASREIPRSRRAGHRQAGATAGRAGRNAGTQARSSQRIGPALDELVEVVMIDRMSSPAAARAIDARSRPRHRSTRSTRGT